MIYPMKSKYAIFSNIKVTKIERSAFLGHPVYIYMFKFHYDMWSSRQESEQLS